LGATTFWLLELENRKKQLEAEITKLQEEIKALRAEKEGLLAGKQEKQEGIPEKLKDDKKSKMTRNQNGRSMGDERTSEVAQKK